MMAGIFSGDDGLDIQLGMMAGIFSEDDVWDIQWG
jgi:hypothetical protein